MGNLKSFLSIILSACLAYQPVLAKSAANQTWTQYNSFFKKTGITSKEVKFKDFYAQNKELYPRPLQLELEAFIKDNPDVLLPKFAVSKVKDAQGVVRLQLQYTQDKQSATMMFFDGASPYVKVGSQKISYPGILSWEKTTAAIIEGSKGQGMRDPASAKQNMPDFLKLSAAEFKKLPKTVQDNYLKEQRLTMAQMESTNESFERFQAIQEQKKGKKKKGKKSAQIFNVLVPTADAAGGTACMIGGHVASNPTDYFGYGECSLATHGTYALGGGAGGAAAGALGGAPVTGAAIGAAAAVGASLYLNRCTFCGRDSIMNSSGATGDNRPILTRGCSGSYQVKCNPAVYGNDSPCVDARSVGNVTEVCNTKVPDLYAGLKGKNLGGVEDFNKMIEDAYGPMKARCAEIRATQSDDTASIKECSALEARVGLLNSAGYCTDAFITAFKTEKPDVETRCSAYKTGQDLPGVADHASVGDGQPLPEVGPAAVKCEDYGMYQIREKGEGENCYPKLPSFDCTRANGQQANVIACNCGDKLVTKINGVWSCGAGPEQTVKSEGSWLKRNKSWLLPLGISGAVIALMLFLNKSAKSSADKYYNNLQPIKPAPSIGAPGVPDMVKPPQTRGVQ